MSALRMGSAKCDVPMKTVRSLIAFSWAIFFFVGIEVPVKEILEFFQYMTDRRAEFLLLRIAIGDHDAVEVIRFMLKSDRKKTVRLHFSFFSMLICIADGNPDGADNIKAFLRDTQTSFLKENLFS